MPAAFTSDFFTNETLKEAYPSPTHLDAIQNERGSGCSSLDGKQQKQANPDCSTDSKLHQW